MTRKLAAIVVGILVSALVALPATLAYFSTNDPLFLWTCVFPIFFITLYNSTREELL